MFQPSAPVLILATHLGPQPCAHPPVLALNHVAQPQPHLSTSSHAFYPPTTSFDPQPHIF